MTFFLGRACWHVVGEDAGWHLSLLCGGRPRDGIGGHALDVIASEMPVCRQCDKATGGEAVRYVERAKELV